MVRRRIVVEDVKGVTVVTFCDHEIMDASNIQELGDELFALVEREGKKKIVLDFSGVESLSAAALIKLIALNKKAKAGAANLRLCLMKRKMREVFTITRLNQLFVICDTLDQAIASFAA
jgi:anti-sigma B factor antagonist